MAGYKLTTSKTWAQTEAELKNSLALWGAETYSLARGRQDDGAKAVRSRPPLVETPEQALVTLTVRWASGRELTLSYNQQARSTDNLRALYLCIEGVRLNELRGLGDVMREAYLQLPAGPASRRRRNPYEVLEVAQGASIAVAEAAYRTLARQRHPDHGGTPELMAELNEAIAALREATK